MKSLKLTAPIALICALSGNASANDTIDIVTNAMLTIGTQKNVGAASQFFSEPYFQHNQTVPTGLAAFQGLLENVVNNPAFSYDLARVIADGDIGIAHGVYVGFGPVPLVAFDVFRVENEKIVEHWDNLAPVAADNASGRSQTDGAVDVFDLEKTAENKALVRGFVTDVMIGGAFDKLPFHF